MRTVLNPTPKAKIRRTIAALSIISPEISPEETILLGAMVRILSAPLTESK
jgi:hypothetical protein